MHLLLLGNARPVPEDPRVIALSVAFQGPSAQWVDAVLAFDRCFMEDAGHVVGVAMFQLVDEAHSRFVDSLCFADVEHCWSDRPSGWGCACVVAWR